MTALTQNADCTVPRRGGVAVKGRSTV